MYHAGVIKALLEEDLLPRVISGSSVGSVYAGFICTKTDSELWDLLEKGNVDLDFFPANPGEIKNHQPPTTPPKDQKKKKKNRQKGNFFCVVVACVCACVLSV